MWVAPQMALKSTSRKGGQHDEEKEGGSQDEEEDPDVQKQDNNSKILAKYRKAIIDQGFNYFRDEDRLWWMRFFEKQEEILRHHLEPEQWRFEWTWPARCTVPLAEEVKWILCCQFRNILPRKLQECQKPCTPEDGKHHHPLGITEIWKRTPSFP